jgi:hypothetical protein
MSYNSSTVLLGLIARVVGLLEGLDHLKGDAFLAEQVPQALMADVVDHPLSHQELGQLGQAPRRERQPVVLRAGQGDLLDLLALGQRERRRAPSGIARVQRLEAVGVEVVDHVSHPVWARESHRGDLLDVHALSRQQHHLGPTPRHDRS